MNVENMDNFIDLVTPEVINLVSPSPLPTIDWETPRPSLDHSLFITLQLKL